MDDGAAIAGSLSNPELFGPHFRGPSWTAWRAFVAALFAAPMTDEQFDLYREHTGRTVAPSKPFTEAALVVGRRGGKSPDCWPSLRWYWPRCAITSRT
jgi:hypothetical protein